MRIVTLLAACGTAAAYVATPPARAARSTTVRHSTLERPVLQATVEDETEKTAYGLGDSENLELPSPYESNRKTPSEFELNLGRAIDALRSDVPAFADRELSWDIYADNLQFADPSGVQTRGLENYKQFFGVIRMFRSVLIDDVDITFKLRYDWAGKKIVITWYSKWYARGSKTAAYVDAKSTFHLNDEGKVYMHAIDNVEVGGRPLSPPYSVGWLAFREYVLAGLGDQKAPVPSFAFEDAHIGQDALLLMAVSDETRKTNKEKRAKNKAAARPKEKKKKLRPGQCEAMWDCDSGMNCCDFVMFKMCCSGGVGIPAFLLPPPQPSLVPIPVPVENGPPGMPGPGGPPPYIRG